MAENMDQILQELSETLQVVKGREDKATLDFDMLAGKIETLQQKLDALNRPVRKGSIFGSVEEYDDIVAGGKFAGHKASDVMFTKMFLDHAWEKSPASSREYIKRPSKELNDTVQKLMDSTTTNAGDEFVPTIYADQLWEEFFLESKVIAALGGGVPMPSDPWSLPAWQEVTWRKGVSGEAPSAQDIVSHLPTMTSTELIAEVDWSYRLDEDSVIAMMPSVRRELARSGAEYGDAFCLNADSTNAATGNINLDDANPPDDSYYLSDGKDGIRHYYIVDRTDQSTDVNSTLDDAEWVAGRARMGKYGVNPDRIVAFTNIKTYLISLMSLTNVRTVDKYGSMATILKGELARVDGVPIVVSESMPLAEDDGKVSDTSSNNDEGQIAFVNRDMWKVGFRRQLMIEVDRDIKKRVFYMVASFRIGIVARDDDYTTTRGLDHCAGIHGITYS